MKLGHCCTKHLFLGARLCQRLKFAGVRKGAFTKNDRHNTILSWQQKAGQSAQLHTTSTVESSHHSRAQWPQWMQKQGRNIHTHGYIRHPVYPRFGRLHESRALHCGVANGVAHPRPLHILTHDSIHLPCSWELFAYQGDGACRPCRLRRCSGEHGNSKPFCLACALASARHTLLSFALRSRCTLAHDPNTQVPRAKSDQ